MGRHVGYGSMWMGDPWSKMEATRNRGQKMPYIGEEEEEGQNR